MVTPGAGKLRVVAKGTRRTKSRMAGHLDLFMRSNLLVARGRQLDIVTQAETIESFRAIRENLLLSAYAEYLSELVDAFAAEQLPNYPLYAAYVTALKRLHAGRDPQIIATAFEMSLLGVTGYRPQLFRCLHCLAEVTPGGNRFSSRTGGILCPNCASADHAAPPVSDDALKVLRNLQTNEEAVLRLVELNESTRQEVERRLRDYISYRMERRPRSLAFLDRLQAEHPR